MSGEKYLVKNSRYMSSDYEKINSLRKYDKIF